MTKENVMEGVLRVDYETLTPSQRRLADYIFQNPYEAALMSSAQIATHLSVSEATVVRFAQALGFEGYPDLRESLKQRLIREVRSSERIATMMNQLEDNIGTLHEIVSQNIFHLNRLLENVKEEGLEKAIELLNQARHIIVIGDGAPGSLTYHVDFWFSRLGYQVKATNQTGRRFFEHIFQANEDDVALIFAFRRASPEALALLEVMNECNGKSILVTDLVSSKMHSLATEILIVQRGPMDAFRSLAPVTTLVDAMILGLMRLQGEQGVERLRQLDNIRHRYGVLYNK